MVIKPVGQSGVSPEPSAVGSIDAASGTPSTSLTAAVSRAADADNRVAIQTAVERAASAIQAGEIGFAEGVSRVISSMASQQLPAGLSGPVRETRLREMEQVFADDPRVAASVERLLRAAAT